MFEIQTYSYEGTVWFRENLEATSSSGHNSASEKVKKSKYFEKKVLLEAGEKKKVTARIFHFLKV